MMIESPKIAYHLRELEIARDPASPGYAMPAPRAQDQRILDIGCGIGQTLIALEKSSHRVLVGVDIDRECLRYGRENYDSVAFVHAGAEDLPFRNGAFDLVISRVALPYTMLGASLPEIARVLADDGWAWLTLHSFTKALSHLQGALRRLTFKDMLFQIYVLGNGAALHCLGRQFRFPMLGVCESFQTQSGMRRDLARAGFGNVRFPASTHFLCIACKLPA